MKENQEQNWQTHDALDHELDIALAKFAAAEPRTGLEERILANLQAEREHTTKREWWRWSAAAIAFATILLVIAGLAWTSIHRAPAIAHRPPTMEPPVQSPAPQIASTRPPAENLTAKLAHRRKPAAPAYPKLDQFPSPQPLSDQERFLASYVEAYPDHAVLLARARAEVLRRDQFEEMRLLSQSDGAADSEDRNSDTSGR